jgi:hypothetical protein
MNLIHLYGSECRGEFCCVLPSTCCCDWPRHEESCFWCEADGDDDVSLADALACLAGFLWEIF